MPKLLVIADDLSGATDVGVQFAKKGIRSFVTMLTAHEQPKLAALFESHDVVLIDIESRHVSAEIAQRRVRTAVEEARSAGVEFFYKKTDSTLRGNVGAELDALLRAAGGQTLCFIPAHPKLGRTTRGGLHFVEGTPLHESAFASDLRNPITESRVAAILARQTTLAIALVPQSEVNAFAKAVPDGLAVFDAETEAEIKRAAEAVSDAGCLRVLAGPAAFASLLPELIPFAREAAIRLRIPSPLLVVNGSLNEVALRQCSLARDHGFTALSLTPEALLSENIDGSNARTSIARQVQSLLGNGRDAVLSSVWSHDQRAAFNEVAMKVAAMEYQRWPSQIASSIGRIVSSILTASDSARTRFALIVFGGDTLAGIYEANQWKGFAPCYEPEPGIALCEIPESHLAVLTKPGGFGAEDVLLKLRHTVGV